MEVEDSEEFESEDPAVSITWKPDPSILALLRSSSQFRRAVPAATILVAAGYQWYLIGRPLLGLVLVAGQLMTVVSFMQVGTRRVRGTPTKAAEYQLAILCIAMQVPKPLVLVRPGDRGTVNVRGTSQKPILVIDRKTELTWSRDIGVASTQLAHELAHVWSKDVSTYRYLTVAMWIYLTEWVFWSFIRVSWDVAIIAPIVIFGVVGLRSYLRSREFAADLLAAQVLADWARDILPDRDTGEKSLLRSVLATHPSPARRRSAFDDPEVLFQDSVMPMAAIGFLSVVSFNCWTGILRWLFPQVSAVGAALILLPLVVGFVSMVFGSYFSLAHLSSTTRIRTAARALFLCEILALVVVARGSVSEDVNWLALAVSVILWTVCAAEVATRAGDAAFIFFSTEPQRLLEPSYRFIQGIIPAVIWVALLIAAFTGLYADLMVWLSEVFSLPS